VSSSASIPSTIDPFDFLKDPVAFATTNPTLKISIKTLWSDTLSAMTANLPLVEGTTFRGTPIKSLTEYNDSKTDLLKMYADIETALGSKSQTVLGMTAKNWRVSSRFPDEDFAEQVKQFFSIVEQVNDLTAAGAISIATLSGAQIICQLYSVVYELATVRINSAASFLNKKMTPIFPKGQAIDILNSRGFTKSMAPFNNHLRNAVAHGNYLVRLSIIGTSQPYIEYADIDSSGKITSGSETISTIQRKTVAMVVFLMASLYVNADRMINLINDCLAKVP
jgi:hypothetical protein